LNPLGKGHTGVSRGGYGAGVRSGRQRSVEPKQVRKSKPALENGFVGARVGEVEEIQPYFG